MSSSKNYCETMKEIFPPETNMKDAIKSLTDVALNNPDPGTKESANFLLLQTSYLAIKNSTTISEEEKKNTLAYLLDKLNESSAKLKDLFSEDN